MQWDSDHLRFLTCDRMKENNRAVSALEKEKWDWYLDIVNIQLREGNEWIFHLLAHEIYLGKQWGMHLKRTKSNSKKRMKWYIKNSEIKLKNDGKKDEIVSENI